MRYNPRIFNRIFGQDMEQKQKTRTPEEEKRARLERCIAVVVFGTLSVLLFFYLSNGIIELIMADALPEEALQEYDASAGGVGEEAGEP